MHLNELHCSALAECVCVCLLMELKKHSVFKCIVCLPNTKIYTINRNRSNLCGAQHNIYT